MKTNSVTYTIRIKLGDYQFEELSATVEQDIENEVSGDELMSEARRICVQNSTPKKKAQEKNG